MTAARLALVFVVFVGAGCREPAVPAAPLEHERWRAYDEPVAKAFVAEVSQLRARNPPFNDTVERNGIESQATSVAAHVVTLASQPPFALGANIQWGVDPFRDRGWQYQLHSMQYIVRLVDQAAVDPDRRWLDAAEGLVLDWIGDNCRRGMHAAGPLAWHDDATAQRVRAWVVFWNRWKHVATPAKLHMFLRCVHVHARMLADARFYTKRHNHGIAQDLALLAIVVTFPDFRNAAAWRALAIDRLRAQLVTTVSPDGVHLEHAAGYHVSMVGLVALLETFASRNGLVELQNTVSPLLANMARFASFLVEPGHGIVTIGDTAWNDTSKRLQPYADLHPWLAYALTDGARGAQPPWASVWQREGYAFVHDRAPASGTPATYFAFTAAAQPGPGEGHKHGDSLGFVLHTGGHRVLVDPGMYSYNHDDPNRRYLISRAAHNVVVVDGDTQKGAAARIERTRQTDAALVLVSSHVETPGVEHRRTVIYLRAGVILVHDEILPRGAEAQHRMDSMFQLGPDVVATSREDGVDLQHGTRVLARLRSSLGAPRIAAGQRDPLLGWYSPSWSRVLPIQTLVFGTTGTSAEFATLIRFATSAMDVPRVERFVWHREAERIAFSWQEDGTARSVLLTEADLEVR
jgi:hypothetical protein